MSLLEVQRITEDAKVPQYTKENQYVLFSSEDKLIPANKTVFVSVGLRVAFPNTHCALIVDYNLPLSAGLVDSDYRGEIRTLVFSPTDVTIKKGDPIARMLMIEVALPEIIAEDLLVELESEDENTAGADN